MELNLQRNQETPLYLRLTQELRRQVEDGVLQPGDRLPSFAELRERYGIHKTTVERAHLLLEQDGLVVREQGRGTFVTEKRNGHAASTQVAKGIIALCGAGFLAARTSSYWAKLLEGIWAGLTPQDAKRALQLLLLDHCSPDAAEKSDGVLINATWRSGERATVPPGLPAVSLLIANQVQELSSVVADDYAGARAATRHLLELGHRRIAYLCSGTDVVIVPRRLAGYRDALQEFGVVSEPKWVRRWPKTPDVDFIGIGHEQMAQWLREGWRDLGCTALLAHNDEAAIGAMEALREIGCDVPGDISVVGFDGTYLSEQSHPRLTTVEVPLREIGEAAIEMLLRQIRDGNDAIEHLTLPTTLRVRESSAPPQIIQNMKTNASIEARGAKERNYVYSTAK
jgi:DNA-binding transcriptional regulator YhcF (GntR family)